MSEKIEFDLTVKNNQLDKALESGINKSSKLEDTLTVALGVFAGNIATKGFELLGDAASASVEIIKESIKAAEDQEVVTNNLNSALSRNGNLTKQTTDELLAYADAMQATTKFTDDSVTASAALLESLTGLNKDGLKQGVSAAADFATVLGIDLETATRLVAKAADGNTEAFKRYGVQIRKGKTDSESFANTVEALNKQFGGSSAAQLNTYQGSLTSLKNAYANMLEPIGDIIVKNPTVIATFNALKDIITDTTKTIGENNSGIKSLVTDGIFLAIAGLEGFLNAMSKVYSFAKLLTATISGLGNVALFGLSKFLELAYDGMTKVLSLLPVVGKEFENLQNPISALSDALSGNVTAAISDFKKSLDPNGFDDASLSVERFGIKVAATADAIDLAAKKQSETNTGRGKSEEETNAQVLAQRAQFGVDLAVINAKIDAENKTFQEQSAQLGITDQAAKNQQIIDDTANQKLREAQIVFDGEVAKAKATQTGENLTLAIQKASAEKRLTDKKIFDEKDLALTKISSEAKVAAQKDTLAQIATLSSSNNKTLAVIGKAAAIAQIAIDGPQAVTKALAAFPPPFNFVAAGLVGAAVAAQAAKVAGLNFESGGFVGGPTGATVGPDNRTANVRDGELVLNADQQRNLLSQLNNGGGSGAPIIIQIDGREIMRAIRNQLNSGYKLA